MAHELERNYTLRPQGSLLPKINYLCDLALRITNYPEDYSTVNLDGGATSLNDFEAEYPVYNSMFTIGIECSRDRFPHVNLSLEQGTHYVWRGNQVYRNDYYLFCGLPIRKFPYRLSQIGSSLTIDDSEQGHSFVPFRYPNDGARGILKSLVPIKRLQITDSPRPKNFTERDCDTLIEAVKWLGLQRRAPIEPAARRLG